MNTLFFRLMWITPAILLAVTGCGEMETPPSPDADLTASRYLLLDDRVVEETNNVRLAVGTVKKHEANPLFGEDKPWEPRFDNLYPNVFYDEELQLYRCWYNPFIVDQLTSAIPRERRSEVEYVNSYREFGLAYATSEDGLKWSKPELGLVEFEGSTANNLLLRGPHGMGILKEPHDPLPERRYKMLYGGHWIGKYEPGPAVRFSKDGLRWSEPIACPEIEAHGGTHNMALWVPELNKYVGTTRIFRGEPFFLHPEGQRVVGRTASPDFLKWSKAEPILSGIRENQTYAMPMFRYGDVYLGLLMIIRLSEERVHCELAWSPDTIRWERIEPGTPFIANSSSEGDYDWGCVYAALSPVVREDEIRIYYAGSNGQHRYWRDGFLCLATLRHDGWAGYQPVDSAQAGMVLTKPLDWPGGLQLCADAAGGSVKVSVLDGAGQVVAQSVAVTGDVTDQQVIFSSSRQLESLTGQLVRLKFELDKAKLYSFALTW